MSLLIGCMLVLVLADNFLLLFLGWQGLGFASYLLLSFDYTANEDADGGVRAFVYHRIGDFALLSALLVLLAAMSDLGTSSLSLSAFATQVDAFAENQVLLPSWLGGGEFALLSILAALFAVAACAQSAQFPFALWLPRATRGPAASVALIHSGTTLGAGVYLVCRLFFVFEAAPGVAACLAAFGAATALYGALVSIVQDDIKKVLAYSTLTHFGLIFVALGCGAYAVAVFHFATHAFTKALLFLGAGSVLRAARGESNLKKLGGLRKRMPRTYILMAVGVAALAGAPPLSGFFSRDEVLMAAFASPFSGAAWLYGISLCASTLSVFALSRLFYLAFHGVTKLDPNTRSRANDPSNLALNPLYAFALLAFLAGLLTPPQFWGDFFGLEASDSLDNFLANVLVRREGVEIDAFTQWQLVALSLALSLGAFLFARWAYTRSDDFPGRIARRVPVFRRALEAGLGLDRLVEFLVLRPLNFLTDVVLRRSAELLLIDTIAIGGTRASLHLVAARILAPFHSGLVQGSVIAFIVGLVALVAFLVV